MNGKNKVILLIIVSFLNYLSTFTFALDKEIDDKGFIAWDNTLLRELERGNLQKTNKSLHSDLLNNFKKSLTKLNLSKKPKLNNINEYKLNNIKFVKSDNNNLYALYKLGAKWCVVIHYGKNMRPERYAEYGLGYELKENQNIVINGKLIQKWGKYKKNVEMCYGWLKINYPSFLKGRDNEWHHHVKLYEDEKSIYVLIMGNSVSAPLMKFRVSKITGKMIEYSDSRKTRPSAKSNSAPASK